MGDKWGPREGPDMSPVSSAEGAGTGPHPRMGGKSSPTQESQTGGMGVRCCLLQEAFLLSSHPADFKDSLSSLHCAGPACSTSKHTFLPMAETITARCHGPTSHGEMQDSANGLAPLLQELFTVTLRVTASSPQRDCTLISQVPQKTLQSSAGTPPPRSLSLYHRNPSGQGRLLFLGPLPRGQRDGQGWAALGEGGGRDSAHAVCGAQS